MLPAHIAQNIRRQILYYLQSTFSFRDKKTDQAFRRFIEDPEAGLFKGPWIHLSRPFRPAPPDVEIPLDIATPFHPFIHQYRAWLRLSEKNSPPQNTIVTTGTGSGKTECFLLPILDHCLRARKQGQKGIRAIILYPMNALAADQEKRFAETIWKEPKLKKAGIRVGNYSGRYDPADPGKSIKSGTVNMGPDHGITNHEAQQGNPPDILLTNYRMLDFLLMRPQDNPLWRHNKPGTLRYLILDELHTYDGAQGADVACLVRRLKDRLQIPRGELCVAGTSATLDDRDDILREIRADGSADAAQAGKEKLAAFAETLFEEDIPPENVIGEDRLEVAEIIRSEMYDRDLPNPRDCQPRNDEDSFRYVIRQSQIWGGPVFSPPTEPDPRNDQKQHDGAVEQWELELGEWLKQSMLFKYLLEIFHKTELQRKEPLSWTDLIDRLTQKEFGLQKVKKQADRKILIASFCSLATHAREMRSKRSSVLVPTQVQLWIRELRRLGRVVSHTPAFSWLDEPARGTKSLPTFHCSECGESGWVAMHNPDSDARINSREVSGWGMESDPTKIYQGWFGAKDKRNGKSRKSQYIFVISPWEKPGDQQPAAGSRQLSLTSKDAEAFYFCPKSLVIRRGDGPCPLTGDSRRFRVQISNKRRKLESGKVIGDQACPRCGSKEGLFFVGARSATLSSVAIDEMFGSVLNNDPKLLAFTDSVQDASHRAGFFSARTYHFAFRTALQHVINESGENGLSLPDVGQRLFDYWSQKKPGRPGSIRETMTALMPPDLQEYKPFLAFRNTPSMDKPPPGLFDEITTRLTWQATSEFGLMQTHGRSMEMSGSACLSWEQEKIRDTVRRLKEKFPGINPVFTTLDDDLLNLWIYGILHRYRERGALSHPYLIPYAKFGYWGKYPFGQPISGREIFPPAIRYKPRLLITAPRRNHEYVLAHTKGGQSPWLIVWTYRSLKEPAVMETDIIDMIRTMFSCGSQAGLFTMLHQESDRTWYAISSEAASLIPGGVHLVCDKTGRCIIRPEHEARFWKNAPTMEYHAAAGRYRIQSFSPRQRYYQDRYNKGALRRVVAEEHTGLLATEHREQIEKSFRESVHADDPNVLTCTSTLEMGIDIGDLSSTMLCSIPPNTASYLQRIGRAGRATGTALIVSVVNQRPHDLFFYARPAEMLKGKVNPPGCWLDASAVLVRQYMGFCFDSATRDGKLPEIPPTGGKLVADLKNPDGRIPTMMDWVMKNESEMQNRFLKRYRETVQEDTRERFLKETDTQLLVQKIHQAANDFDRLHRDLENSRRRLNNHLGELDEGENEDRLEIRQELKILQGRIRSLRRTATLEIFTDCGLLPNYAFPEKGVRFYGAIYNMHQHDQQDHEPVEIYRNATAALREIAPFATFYTHRRQFDIQQILIGSRNQLLTEIWGICGLCGHMRRIEEISQPDADPACPQCGHSGDRRSQFDLGQQKPFVEFAQSQALSYMEHYESLSGDRDEERQRGFYDMIHSFDQTRERSAGAVGDDALPFGIEYRSSMILREINTGYAGEHKEIPFGPDTLVSDSGFFVCRHCGVALPPEVTPENADTGIHRKSCSARRKYEKLRKKGKAGNPYQYLSLYLYRELKSEAIRLLLPLTDDEDIYTLIACIILGLRLRFEGNPAHLIVQFQVMPDSATGLNKHYLVIMDAVPGGTGFLKTLYQEKDDRGREGQGIMDVLQLARDALETCPCRKLVQENDKEHIDGCYRCIRTYHLQYKAEKISRELGIRLLGQLIASGEKRISKGDLERIKPDSLFGSVLEKKFVKTLRTYIEDQKGGWEETIIKGGRGFRFSMPKSDRIWELELQPSLGTAQGVMIPSQPDFLLRCDDDAVKPVAIFTDGFEFHCHPNNRLADDMKKRRAVLESGNYRIWSVTWEDLLLENQNHIMVCHQQLADFLVKCHRILSQKHKEIPDPQKFAGNGMAQLKAFLAAPGEAGWKLMTDFALFRPLQILSQKRRADHSDLQNAMAVWRTGSGMPLPVHRDTGEWIYNDRASLTQDFVAYISNEHALINAKEHTGVAGRLGDTDEEVSGSDFKERWRRFLACMNLFQFNSMFTFWTTSEAVSNEIPENIFAGKFVMSEEWKAVFDDMISSLKPVVEALAKTDIPVPCAEYVNDTIDDDAFAELAWVSDHVRIAVLAGDQADFATAWQDQGWRVILPDDIEAKGVDWLIDEIKRIN